MKQIADDFAEDLIGKQRRAIRAGFAPVHLPHRVAGMG